MNEAFEQFGIVFPTDDESAEVMQPTDRAFHFVSTPVSSQRAAVLRGGLHAVLAMRADERDAADVECVTKPVGIGRSVVHQALRLLLGESFIDERFDRVDLADVGGRGERGQRRPLAVDHQHDRRAFAFAAIANLGAPFLPVQTSHHQSLLPR